MEKTYNQLPSSPVVRRQLLGPVTALRRFGRCRSKRHQDVSVKLGSHSDACEARRRPELSRTEDIEWFLAVGVGHQLEVWHETTLTLLGTTACLPEGQVIHGVESTPATTPLPWLVVFGGRHLSLCRWTASDQETGTRSPIVRCLAYTAEAWILAVSIQEVTATDLITDVQEDDPAHKSTTVSTEGQDASAVAALAADENGCRSNPALHIPTRQGMREDTTTSLAFVIVLANGSVMISEVYRSSRGLWCQDTHRFDVLDNALYWSAALTPNANMVALGTADGYILVQPLVLHPWQERASAEERARARTVRRYRAHRGPVYSLCWVLPFDQNERSMIACESKQTREQSSYWLCSCADDRTIQCFRVTVLPERSSFLMSFLSIRRHLGKAMTRKQAAWMTGPPLWMAGGDDTLHMDRIALFRGHQARPWALRAYRFCDTPTTSAAIIVCSVGEDNTARLWDVQRGCCIRAVRMHRLRNIWCLDMGLVSTSLSRKDHEPIWLWLYSGGADGTVGLFPLTWPLGLVSPTPTGMQRERACVPRNRTVKTTDLDARSPEMIESVPGQECGSVNSVAIAAPALPPLEHHTSTLLPGREHARAMVMLASVQLLCISTNARRVLACSVDRLDWTELFSGDDSIDFVPASIAAADKSPWVFFGASHCRSTILALQLGLPTKSSSAPSPIVSIRSERWQARTELEPVTLLHLWNDQVLFAATADGTVLAFDLTNWLDNHQPRHSLKPFALFPVPDGVVSQPSAIGLIPASRRADKTSPARTWKASLDAVVVGHRSGQMRLHPIPTTTATTPTTVPCTQCLRPHEDRLSSILVSSNDAVDDANTENNSGTLHVLSMDGTCSRFQRLSDTERDGGTLRLVLCSREKCPVECEQGDVLYRLSEGARAWSSTRSRVQGSALPPARPVLLASGFRGHHYGVWRLETGQTLFVVPCGGWRRPHVLYERRSTTTKEGIIGFAFWRAGKLYRYEQIVQCIDGVWSLPRRIRVEGAAMRIQALLVLPAGVRHPSHLAGNATISASRSSRTTRCLQQNEQCQTRVSDSSSDMYWLVTASEDTSLDLYRWHSDVSAERGDAQQNSLERIASGSACHFSGILCIAGIPWPSQRFFAGQGTADERQASAPMLDYLVVSGGGSDTLGFWRISAVGLGLVARYIRSRSRAPFASALCRPSCESLARVTALALKPIQYGHGCGAFTNLTRQQQQQQPQQQQCSHAPVPELEALECHLLCGRSDGTLSLYWLRIAASGIDQEFPSSSVRFYQHASDHNWYTSMVLLAERPWQGHVYPRALCSVPNTSWFLVGDTSGAVALYSCSRRATGMSATLVDQYLSGATEQSQPWFLAPVWEHRSFLAAAVNAIDGFWFQHPTERSSEWLLLVAGGDDQHFRFLLLNPHTSFTSWCSERTCRHTGAITGLQMRLLSMNIAEEQLLLVMELWTWATDRSLQRHQLRLQISSEQVFTETLTTDPASNLFGIGDPATLVLVPDRPLVAVGGHGVAVLFPENTSNATCTGP